MAHPAVAQHHGNNRSRSRHMRQHRPKYQPREVSKQLKCFRT